MYNQLTHTGGEGGGGGGGGCGGDDDHIVTYVKKYCEYVYAFAFSKP